MIFYNTHKHLLQEQTYSYSLQDVAEPNLFREFFDYENVPRTAFDFFTVPMNTPESLWITDTTFRDGQQSMQPFTVEQIVDLFKMLHRLGGKKGIVKQSEFFLYSEKDRAAVRACQELGYEFPEITSWIRATDSDFELVKEMGIKETGILVSCSDYHIFNKLHLTRAQAMDKYLSIVKKALDRGIVPRAHLEDITRADSYGYVVPFVRELMKLSKESGIPIKVRACDTMGYGVTYPGSSLPRSVPRTIYGLWRYGEVPSEQMEWHGHNDFYKVVTNAATAWLYGCSAVNCALLGIGERTGNCPLEAMAVEYASLKGTTDGMDLSVITEIADYFKREIGYKIPPRTPFVGRDFNVTRAGVHVDGLMKDEEIYNIFNTAKILNRPPMVCVDNNSGLAGIAYWINNHYNLPESEKVLKSDPMIAHIKARVDEMYASGRVPAMSDDELDELVRESDEARYKTFVTIAEKGIKRK